MNWFAPTHRPTGGAIVVAAVMLACAAPARAQYFGQNKVQYDAFHFHVLKTSHFDVYYYPVEAQAAQRAGRMAERWYTRLSTILGHRLTGRQPLVLYASHAEFAQTNVVEGLINEGTGGVTEGLRRRVVLPLAVSLGDTDHVIGHELVHAFQYDMLGQGVSGLPLWFIEGMAEYLSLGPRDAATAMWLRDAVLEDRMPTIDDLDNPEYFPYRFGQAFWAYIGGRWGDPTIGTIMKSLASTARNTRLTEADAIAAIEAATELTHKTLSQDWAHAVRTLYHVAPRPRGERAPAAGTPLVAEAHGRSGLDVGPALSPDGSKIAFLSERNRLAVDLYVADARTGAIRRRLTRNAVDPHFQSLQFIQSAGAWAPDNRRLAVAAVHAGRAELSIFDTATGGILRELPFDRTGEIFQPAWSPDGRTIAFAAEVGGVTDLYTCDVASGRIRQRTHDAYADLEPAWSPDGRRLVFVTDRFTTDLDTLEPGRMQLAMLEVSTGDVHRLPLTLGGDATDPQWADGATLLFISDATGRPEVYRVAAAGGPATRLTEALTGVTGITPLSPALSVAAGRVVFSVFHDSGYQIQALGRAGASSEVATTTPADDGHSSASSVSLALLPPANRQASLVGRELRTPAEGLPAARHYPSTPVLATPVAHRRGRAGRRRHERHVRHLRQRRRLHALQ